MVPAVVSPPARDEQEDYSPDDHAAALAAAQSAEHVVDVAPAAGEGDEDKSGSDSRDFGQSIPSTESSMLRAAAAIGRRTHHALRRSSLIAREIRAQRGPDDRRGGDPATRRERLYLEDLLLAKNAHYVLG